MLFQSRLDVKYLLALPAHKLEPLATVFVFYLVELFGKSFVADAAVVGELARVPHSNVRFETFSRGESCTTHPAQMRLLHPGSVHYHLQNTSNGCTIHSQPSRKLGTRSYALQDFAPGFFGTITTVPGGAVHEISGAVVHCFKFDVQENNWIPKVC